MIRKLPYILLGLSITFNVFFAGGFLKAQYTTPRAETDNGAAGLVAQRLGLSEDQKRAYTQLREDMLAKVRQVREAVMAARQEFWSQMSNPSAEPHKVRDLVEFEAEQGRQLRLQMADHYKQFMNLLTAEQRTALLEAIHKREGAAAGGRVTPPWLQSSGNAKPGETPGTALREMIQNRWPDAQRWRQRWLERFDTNGDGKLSDDERAEALKALEALKAGGNHPDKP